jgi:protein-S-isoprenylcysteine O-methyltransferase Ste14
MDVDLMGWFTVGAIGAFVATTLYLKKRREERRAKAEFRKYVMQRLRDDYQHRGERWH